MYDTTSSTYYKRVLTAMTTQPLEIEHALQICEWTYEPPFEHYGWPSWEHMKKNEIEFGDSVLRQQQYAAIVDTQLTLIGFAQFFPMNDVTRLGLGLRPDLCSHGIGPAFTRHIALEARKRAPANDIDLEVLTSNTRAIRAYEKAGFTITDTYSYLTKAGMSEFHCMLFMPKHNNGHLS